MSAARTRSSVSEITREFFGSPVAEWLSIEKTAKPHVYAMRFAERHIGNPFIRALHGGAVGAMIEASAEVDMAFRQPGMRADLVSSSIDYLRVTRDTDLFASVAVVRIARRLAFLDVSCWQDDENLPVAHGKCTLRIFPGDPTKGGGL